MESKLNKRITDIEMSFIFTHDKFLIKKRRKKAYTNIVKTEKTILISNISSTSKKDGKRSYEKIIISLTLFIFCVVLLLFQSRNKDNKSDYSKPYLLPAMSYSRSSQRNRRNDSRDEGRRRTSFGNHSPSNTSKNRSNDGHRRKSKAFRNGKGLNRKRDNYAQPFVTSPVIRLQPTTELNSQVFITHPGNPFYVPDEIKANLVDKNGISSKNFTPHAARKRYYIYASYYDPLKKIDADSMKKIALENIVQMTKCILHDYDLAIKNLVEREKQITTLQNHLNANSPANAEV